MMRMAARPWPSCSHGLIGKFLRPPMAIPEWNSLSGTGQKLFMRLAHAEVEWFSSLSHHPAKASADQNHRGVGTRLCGGSRQRAGSRRGRVSAEPDYMGSPAGIHRSTSDPDSETPTSDRFP